jgi:N-acetylmuramoyl-L-alanine amidase
MSAMLRSPLPYLLILTLLACAPKPRHRPPLARFYDRLQEPLDTLDVGSLAGRSIVIDPGHGGVFRGAVGLEGLDEADVNLGVALYLWGLLDEAGAQVYLTRKTDRDFVGGDSLALRKDLEARVAMVNQVGPDVFMSLHHNAHFARDRTVNEIQVYYKMGDEGPSLDLARAVARHLRGNIGETVTRVLPGNYYVLRNSEVPSILCEPSFISNPQIESKLKLADKQRLEAEVYFIALADYFSRGTPRIVRLAPQGRVAIPSPRMEVVFDAGCTIDPASVSIRVDGKPFDPFTLGPNSFAAFPPEPLRDGTHSLRAAGRAVGGNSAREEVEVFDVDLDAATISLRAVPKTCSPPYPQKITALVLDGQANPLRDGTEVEFGWEGGQRTEKAIDGEASVFLGREVPFGVADVSAACENVSVRISIEPSPESPRVSGFVVDPEHIPIEGAAVTASNTLVSAVTDRDGFFTLDPGAAPEALEVSKSGFRKAYTDVKTASYPTIEMARFYAGIEPGLTVTIDPQGGGSEAGWVGPTGITASDLNLEIARRAAAALRSAGVETRLTRETDREVSDGERVSRCEANHSAVLISLTHARVDPEQVRIDHFPGSRSGALLAGYLAEEIEGSGSCKTHVGETADYIIQQTSCPAVEVTFPAGQSARDEIDLSADFNLWKKTYAVCCAVLRYLGVDGSATFTASGRVTSGGKPVPHAVVTIDGSFEVLADNKGRFTARLLERGSHTVQAFSSGRESASVAFHGPTDSIALELPPSP